MLLLKQGFWETGVTPPFPVENTCVCAHLPKPQLSHTHSSNNPHNSPQGEALPSAPAFQLIEQSNNLPRSRAAQGVAQSYRTPQGVHLLCRNS